MDFLKNLSQAKKIVIAGGIAALVLVVGIYLLMRSGPEDIAEDTEEDVLPPEIREQVEELDRVRQGSQEAVRDGNINNPYEGLSEEEKIERQSEDLQKLRGQHQ